MKMLLIIGLYPVVAILGALATLLVRKRLVITPSLSFKLNGQSLTDGLRAFNEWRDDFLIELSTLMLMVGFVIGTVDVFTSGGLSNIPTFNYAWAIIQAIAIDGLFFAVWGRIKRATWTRATWFANLMLIIVGLLLAVVASLVNGLLSYQELNHIANVAQAMEKMHVDQGTFTYARAILVVLVSILVALFGRTYSSDKKATEQKLSVALADVARVTELNTGLQATTKELQSTIDGLREELRALEEKATARMRSPRAKTSVAQEAQAIAIAEKATGYEGASYVAQEAQAIAIAEKATGYNNNGLQATSVSGDSSDERATESPIAQTSGLQATRARATSEPGERATSEKATGYVAQDDGSTIAIGDGKGQVMIATGSARERIKQAMLQAIEDGRDIKYDDIAQIANVGYSTVKKWAGEVREELQIELANAPIQLDKLALTMEALKNNPALTDEELAPLLNLKRPASARFWKLKAIELLAQEKQTERTTDKLASVSATA